MHLNYCSVYALKACEATKFGEAPRGIRWLRMWFRFPFYNSCSDPATELDANSMFAVYQCREMSRNCHVLLNQAVAAQRYERSGKPF